MRKGRLLVLALVVIAALTIAFWKRPFGRADSGGLLLYGNVDLRQVELAFNATERVSEVLVEEGDRVRPGQVLAKLETSRLKPLVDQADAQTAVQAHIVERLHNGSRQEEIAQSKASVESANADAANARLKYERLKTLLAKKVTSQEEFDNAKAILDVSEAKLSLAQKAYDLAVAGPRKEEIAEAEARLRSAAAQQALAQRQLADAELIAPIDGTVRSRLREPGEMASPQQAVVSLSIPSPKWVRAYVSEPDLAKVRPGTAATVSVDSFPERQFAGWVGYLSSVAEFTPKTVQTEELRTSLVYEVRVFIKDSADELRLGMPASVHMGTSVLTTEQQRAGGG